MTRGALLACAVARPATAPAVVRLAPRASDVVEPHRLTLALVSMLRADDPVRVRRGAEQLTARALAALPPLTPAAGARARELVDRVHTCILALPDADRVPVLLALAYQWHEDSPATPPWRDVAAALDALQAHGGDTITDAHEAEAARIAGEVLR